MSKEINPRMRTAIDMHVIKGVPINMIQINKENRIRLEIVTEVVGLFNKNKLTSITDILDGAYRRRGIDRTSYTRNMDMLCINLMMSYFTAASRNISMLQVDEAANKLITMGAQSGNAKALQGGAELKAKIHKLYEDEPENKGDRPSFNFVLTDDPQAAGIDRQKLSEDQEEQIRKKYGITTKQIEKVRKENEEIIADLGYADYEEIENDPIERMQPPIE